MGSPEARRLCLLLLALTTSACKPPRSPREVRGAPISGAWDASSVAVGAPLDTGTMHWQLDLLERAGGMLEGSGELRHAGGAEPFMVRGLRGENQLEMELEFRSAQVRFHGGVRDARTLVGEVQREQDTVAVTFHRR